MIIIGLHLDETVEKKTVTIKPLIKLQRIIHRYAQVLLFMFTWKFCFLEIDLQTIILDMVWRNGTEIDALDIIWSKLEDPPAKWEVQVTSGNPKYSMLHF